MTYVAGSSIQQVYEYVNSPSAKDFGTLFNNSVKVIYYLLPNLSSFDLQVYAIYGVPLQLAGLLLTFCYFSIYTVIVMTIAAIIFQKREFK